LKALTTLYTVLLAVDVLLAMGVITLVLLQHGKGADAGAAFGSGASATVFGARGSTSFLSKATGILAALFFMNSLALAYLASHQSPDQSVVDKLSAPVSAPASVTEGPIQDDIPGSKKEGAIEGKAKKEDVPAAGHDDIPVSDEAVPQTEPGNLPADIPQ
jgi:preprotein translocase subunit SecG